MEAILLRFYTTTGGGGGGGGTSRRTISQIHMMTSTRFYFYNNTTRLIHSRILSSSSSKTLISIPQKPSHFPKFVDDDSNENPQITKPTTSRIDIFREKLLYLDSIGIDIFSILKQQEEEQHDGKYEEEFNALNLIVSSSLDDMKSTIDFIRSMGFSSIEFRRICGMCPEILAFKVSEVIPVFTFLLREAKVMGSDIRKVINRRPRLLVCNVERRLRPTLYFLQSIGIAEVHKHTSLLSCSVEDKFIPRIEYLENIGFTNADALSMLRRFPQLFCYSIKNNFEPKFDYFYREMGRDLEELKEFPQYFSFSLENRIKPRHLCCVEKDVHFPLPVMLKTCDTQFRDTLEVCRSSSLPLRTSPLWCTSTDSYNSIPCAETFAAKNLEVFTMTISLKA
ncbi:hypothetical protein MKW92_017137 [Papaver armeniacum]|nr:hypothetical protein MKW92_017137 [Papaver armeniacum]